MSPPARLRLAVREDAPSLAEIFLRCWRDAYRGIVADAVIDSLDPAGLEQRWAELAGGSPDELVVATQSGVPVGMARFGADGDDPDRGHLFSLYVSPDASGAGIGRALLERAMAGFAQAGYEMATLWVFAGNERAIRFYRASGWEPTGEQRVEDAWGALELQLATRLAPAQPA